MLSRIDDHLLKTDYKVATALTYRSEVVSIRRKSSRERLYYAAHEVGFDWIEELSPQEFRAAFKASFCRRTRQPVLFRSLLRLCHYKAVHPEHEFTITMKELLGQCLAYCSRKWRPSLNPLALDPQGMVYASERYVRLRRGGLQEAGSACLPLLYSFSRLLLRCQKTFLGLLLFLISI